MKKNFWKALGPGLIWAAAAIGVSHLVQSTRAGANYGFQLVIVVLLANLFKYPFFQYGPRYAIATQSSLVEGYRKRGVWTVVLFLLITVSTMFTIQAAVTSVTVGIILSIFPIGLSYTQVTVLLLLLCTVIVLIGHYKTLDRIIKFVIVLLSISTLVAIFAAFGKVHPAEVRSSPFEWNLFNISFLVALVGWMPSALDISVWSSLWTLAKMKETRYRPTLKESLLDFNIGYFGTVFMALAFLSLGALVMFNQRENFADSGAEFSNQLFNLYTATIGNWSYFIIALAALATMFSTTLTVFDAYPRVLTPVAEALFATHTSEKQKTRLSYIWIILLGTGATLLIASFSTQMKLLVDIASSMSFVTAPILAVLNLRAITGKEVPPEYRPGKAMLLLSWVGIVVLSVFAVYFLWISFIQ